MACGEVNIQNNVSILLHETKRLLNNALKIYTADEEKNKQPYSNKKTY